MIESARLLGDKPNKAAALQIPWAHYVPHKRRHIMIDTEVLDEVFKDCLYRDEELEGLNGQPPADAVLVEGVVSRFGFNPQRLTGHKTQVEEWLRDLPHEFRASDGGGWSFLQACNDAEGHQWGEHRNMEQLFSLAIGLGLAKYVLPREAWSVFPGSMPYITVFVEDKTTV